MRIRRSKAITRPLSTTTLAQAVADELRVSDEDGKEVIEAVFSIISRAAAAGHNTSITNFGTFVSYQKSARTTRNPLTGEPVKVAAHRAVKFRPSPRLADAVRRRDSKATIRKLPKTAAKTAKAGGER
ncbi:MAG TPA: HU family DNA-binding protein [Streptomyces sp.]|nr:HU family DNA-binding protein [Streptomyces sp.]